MSKENLDNSNEWHLWTQMPYVHYKKTNNDKNKDIQLPNVSEKDEKQKKKANGQKENCDLSYSDDESLYAKSEKENQKQKV